MGIKVDDALKSAYEFIDNLASKDGNKANLITPKELESAKGSGMIGGAMANAISNFAKNNQSFLEKNSAYLTPDNLKLLVTDLIKNSDRPEANGKGDGELAYTSEALDLRAKANSLSPTYVSSVLNIGSVASR
jgi:hypothetical protein